MPALLPLPGKVEEEPGSWGEGEGPEAGAWGKVTTTAVQLALFIVLLHNFHLEPQYYW